MKFTPRDRGRAKLANAAAERRARKQHMTEEENTAAHAKWAKGRFLVGNIPSGGAREVSGSTFAGLGIEQHIKQSPKGRRAGLWVVTHLGTGHAICIIEAKDARVWDVATDIAKLGDWTFDGLDGWKNSDPELHDKFKSLRALRPEIKDTRGGPANREIAAQIATARA